jgi:hypothetical protein
VPIRNSPYGLSHLARLGTLGLPLLHPAGSKSAFPHTVGAEEWTRNMRNTLTSLAMDCHDSIHGFDVTRFN